MVGRLEGSYCTIYGTNFTGLSILLVVTAILKSRCFSVLQDYFPSLGPLKSVDK